jgi:acyl-CoA thioester hydrolase
MFGEGLKLSEVDVKALLADNRVSWTEEKLRYSDLDMNGHVNNACFATFCESGRVTLIRKLFPMADREGFFTVIVRLEINFKAELFFPGTVRTATWFTRVGNSSFTMDQVLLRDDDVVAAVATGTCVACDFATRRPLPFTEEQRALFLPYMRG